MGTYADDATVESTAGTIAVLIATIYHATSSIQTMQQNAATIALKKWASAADAELRLSAETLSSYSSPVGMSAQKRQLEAAQAAVVRYWDELVDACYAGKDSDGDRITLPSLGQPGVTYWDKSRSEA